MKRKLDDESGYQFSILDSSDEQKSQTTQTAENPSPVFPFAFQNQYVFNSGIEQLSRDKPSEVVNNDVGNQPPTALTKGPSSL